MRVLVTGASGLIGSALCDRLLDGGEEVVGTSRDPDRASVDDPRVEWVGWEPQSGPAPAGALSGCDAVVHLLGERLDQRWSEEVKRRIRESRVEGTRNLVAGIAAAEPRPSVLVSGSAVGYYGPRGDEPLDEEEPPGDDFLAGVLVAWEEEARRAEDHGLRVVCARSGVVLAGEEGALSKMLTPFRLGVGGPVAGGDQYMSWIHLEDEVAMLDWALRTPAISGAVNLTAPEPVTNHAFSKALGRALRRPALLPVPGFALRILYGEMAIVVTEGQRAVPRRAQEHGYRWRYVDVEEALRDALA